MAERSTFPPAAEVPRAVRGRDKYWVRLAQIAGGQPDDPQGFAAQTPEGFLLPGWRRFRPAPRCCSRQRGAGRQPALAALQAVMLRLLLSLPPGKVRYTIVDPVGLGENFAAFMHLTDFNEALVTSRIWTDPRHIEQRLADLSEHMENVIQKYLRNEFQSIEQYNRDAGEIAEPFRSWSLPTSRPISARRPSGGCCRSRPAALAAASTRLIMADTQLPLAQGLSLRDFEAHANVICLGRHPVRLA